MQVESSSQKAPHAIFDLSDLHGGPKGVAAHASEYLLSSDHTAPEDLNGPNPVICIAGA